MAEIHAALGAGLATGSLSPVVGELFRLEEVAMAHQQVIEHSGGTRGKICLRMADTVAG